MARLKDTMLLSITVVIDLLLLYYPTQLQAQTDYCAEAVISGMNCQLEKRCIPYRFECDGSPDCGVRSVASDEMDCSDHCSHGAVRLLGATKEEGLVEVCVGTTYLPVSLEDGEFSVREANVVCTELELGNAGIPLSGGSNGVSIEAELIAQVKCTGNETSIAGCTITSTALNFTMHQQAQVRCFDLEEPSCEDGMIRLSPDGPTPNEGRVEMCYQNIWGAVYDQNWSQFDAAVACTQLNFSRTGALPITGIVYGPVDRVPFVYASPNCTGNETSLLDCPSNGQLQELGRSGFYQDQSNGLENLVAVRCDDFPASGCNYLDARLTFRRAVSTGHLEICNEVGQWSVVCGNSPLPVENVRVVCNQLGFDPNFVRSNNLPQSTSVLNVGRPVTSVISALECTGNELDLTTCPQTVAPLEQVPEPCSSLEIQCGAPPRITFNPPNETKVYITEVGRRFSLSCSFDQNVHPLPNSFGVSRLNGNITAPRQSGNAYPALRTQAITLVDADTYYCSGTYGNEQTFEDSVNVTVRGLMGTVSSAYLRVSSPSLERLNAAGFNFSSHDELLNNAETLVFESIPEGVPGVHTVRCRTVPRRAFDMDVLRRLDRIECQVTQYSYQGEAGVEPVVNVVARVALLLPRLRSVSLFQDPVAVSGMGFCDEELILTESGTTFHWEEIEVPCTATFECPLGERVPVGRSCGTGGVWGTFDENACGESISGRLNNLVDLFSNLTTETYGAAVSNLSSIIELSESNTNEQNSEVLSTVANYTTKLATFVGDSNVIINDMVVQEVAEVVSSLLQWDQENIETASSTSSSLNDVLQSFEDVLSRYAQQLSLNQDPQIITAPSLIIVAELRSTATFSNEGRTFTISGNMSSLDQAMPSQLSSQQAAAITLPPSIFGHEILTDHPNVGVFFGRYENSTLFPVRRNITNGRLTQVGSQVLAATVGQNLPLRNLPEPVIITLQLQIREGLFTAPGSEMCVSWDFDMEQWTTDGCNTSVGQGGIITCRCNHLTNFAILVDVCTVRRNCATTCEAEFIRSETGTTYVWPETAIGDVATFGCPLVEDRMVIVSRFCGAGGEWSPFDETACGVVNEQLNRLNDSFNNLTTETVDTAVASLAQAVELTQGNEVEQNSAVLRMIANYLTDVATFVNNTNVTINSTVVESVAQVVNSLLQWNPENIVVDSSSRVVQSFEIVAYSFAQQLGVNETQDITLNSLTILTELRSITSLSVAGRSFAIGLYSNEFVVDDEDQVMPGQLSAEHEAAISLPASLFQTITDREDVGMFFALYNASTLLPVNGGRNRNAPRRRGVGSHILAAIVGPGLNFSNLVEDVTIVLELDTTEFSAPGSEVCASWSFTLQDWTTEGCTTDVTLVEEGIVTCSCSHLTNFAILVDICSRQEHCQSLDNPVPVVGDLLTYVSYIGMSISIVALAVTTVTLLIFKELRQRDVSKYHIQLSLAMLFMLIVSLALVAQSVQNVTDPYGGCVMVSILVHYFTLVAVMWMGAEALLMFQKLVIVFTRVTTKFIVYVSVICWTVPILFFLIPLIVDMATGDSATKDIIARRPYSKEDISFCFLSHPGAFWGAFLVPIIAIMIFNIVIFICVIVVLIRHARDTAARLKKPVSNKTIIRLMISVSGVMFLFGLTWLFAILTFSVTGLRQAFQILFTIFNSFQGFFIFVFFCVFNKEVLESWKELLSCGKYKSKLLHPSQAKYISTAMANKLKPGTTASGLTVSSREKYASGSSVFDYESATLEKRNAYEKAPSETTQKVNLGTSSIVENPVAEDGGLTEVSPELIKPMIVPVIRVEQTDSVSGDAQNGRTAGSSGENGKKKEMALSLKARIKRYTTKKASKHHEEDAEVDFISNDSSQDSSGENNTTTQF